jgi:hypothetical protein
MSTRWLLFAVVAVSLLLATARAQVSRPETETTGSALAKGDPARGRYIVEHVAMCIECHSERDGRGTIIPGREFQGGAIPTGSPPWATSWAERAPRNAGLPGYDDAAALRLLTQGAIGRTGEQLRLPMPRFRMTVDDASDVIAFMRSIS